LNAGTVPQNKQLKVPPKSKRHATVLPLLDEGINLHFPASCGGSNVKISDTCARLDYTRL